MGVVNPETILLDIDYERYAEAEAALGWLNAKGIVASDEGFSIAQWLEKVFASLKDLFEQDASAIAHIKMQVTIDSTSGHCSKWLKPLVLQSQPDGSGGFAYAGIAGLKMYYLSGWNLF